MRPGRLNLLRLGQVALDQGAFHAVAAQPGAGDLGVIGERDFELLAVVGAVPRDLARRQVVVAVGLIAHGSEATAPQDTISHGRYSFRSCEPWALLVGCVLATGSGWQTLRPSA
ncbi:hypothetical protein I917_14455 [Mycobacterium tuberculosis str. Haarlem/NITR202]|uniref:Uncharacterized protein n=1 Tax=Mycobacterium tuberculosis str. Haarlem/NITR202 TaxID=1304279 RepID=R4LYV4_MYCTX|nr:hypothetical protein I917_14455 [Mycobacterium tuberculosis str. Haarlem/NITR202]